MKVVIGTVSDNIPMDKWQRKAYNKMGDEYHFDLDAIPRINEKISINTDDHLFYFRVKKVIWQITNGEEDEMAIFEHVYVATEIESVE